MPSDDFNRADGGLGSNWSTFGSWSGLQIASTQLVSTAGNENAAYYNAWSPGSANQYAEITLVAYGDGGPMVRVHPAGPDAYLAIGRQFSSALYRVVASGYTLLGSGAGLQVSGGLGLVLRIEAEETTIRLKCGGVTLITATDGVITGAGVGGGQYNFNTTGTYDDWVADVIGGSRPRYIGI